MHSHNNSLSRKRTGDTMDRSQRSISFGLISQKSKSSNKIKRHRKNVFWGVRIPYRKKPSKFAAQSKTVTSSDDSTSEESTPNWQQQSHSSTPSSNKASKPKDKELPKKSRPPENRLSKVRRYWKKKYSLKKNKGYSCRKQIAEKRLRVEGRFVTKEKAFLMLGLTQEDLLTNETI